MPNFLSSNTPGTESTQTFVRINEEILERKLAAAV
jgi:hypothetical protein